MKNLKTAFQQEAAKFSRKCNPIPGHWNSCTGCKTCKKKRNFGEDDLPPMPQNYELREDDSIELREDDSFELREIFN